MFIHKCTYNLYMDFKNWFTHEFINWEKAAGERKTVSQFAEFLEVRQEYVSRWMNGNSQPGKKYIPILAKKLGNKVYSELGMSPPDILGDAPPQFKSKFLAALEEANKRYSDRGGITEEEAESILFEVMREHGFKITSIE